MQSIRDNEVTMSRSNSVSDFLVSDLGRMVRVGLGAGLIGIGIGRGGVVGGIISALGLEPLLAGLFNFSLVSMLTGNIIQGEDVHEVGGYEDYSHVDDSMRSAY